MLIYGCILGCVGTSLTLAAALSTQSPFATPFGQEVEAKIIGFDDNRITLSIKELLPAPEEAPAPQEGEAPAEPTDEEKAAKRAQRAKKFEKKEDGAEPKRERRGAKKEASNEPKEWVSGSSNA